MNIITGNYVTITKYLISHTRPILQATISSYLTGLAYKKYTYEMESVQSYFKDVES